MNDIYKYLLEDLRIAITDDHDLVLEGFKSFLEKKNIRHVETFTTAQQLINTLTSRDFDIYIIDSFGQVQQLSFSFNNDSSEETPE